MGAAAVAAAAAACEAIRPKPDWSMAHNPPDSPSYYKFACEKWDHEYARNLMLNWIKQKGLDEEFHKWLEENFPDERP